MTSNNTDTEQTLGFKKKFLSMPGGFLGPFRLVVIVFSPVVIVCTVITVLAVRGDHLRRPKFSLYAGEGMGKESTLHAAMNIQLADVRFVLCNEERRLFTELADGYGKVLDPFVESDSDRALLDEGFMNTRLARSIQDRVFGFIGEKPGDVYTVLFPDSFVLRSCALRGVAVISSGDGYRGFVGVLDEEYPRDFVWRGPETRVCGLSFKGVAALRGLLRASKPNLRDDAREVQENAASFLHLSDCHLQYTWDIYCQYPRVKGVVAIVRDNSTGYEYLMPMMESDGAWLPIPAETTAGLKDDEGRLVYLTVNPESGFYMASPQLSLLPDIDGNGADEILLTSDIVNVLFSIEPVTKVGDKKERVAPYVMREVRGLSFAV